MKKYKSLSDYYYEGSNLSKLWQKTENELRTKMISDILELDTNEIFYYLENKSIDKKIVFNVYIKNKDIYTIDELKEIVDESIREEGMKSEWIHLVKPLKKDFKNYLFRVDNYSNSVEAIDDKKFLQKFIKNKFTANELIELEEYTWELKREKQEEKQIENKIKNYKYKSLSDYYYEGSTSRKTTRLNGDLLKDMIIDDILYKDTSQIFNYLEKMTLKKKSFKDYVKNKNILRYGELWEMVNESIKKDGMKSEWIHLVKLRKNNFNFLFRVDVSLNSVEAIDDKKFLQKFIKNKLTNDELIKLHRDNYRWSFWRDDLVKKIEDNYAKELEEQEKQQEKNQYQNYKEYSYINNYQYKQNQQQEQEDEEEMEM
ncbi:Mbov_0392 family ICE element protein [[Mycoplasma] collis]|uniref:Mbov_0392 family ICE element protein n=1 Tax=[Mycoplasma] collis TaxID=2127 RepID=UPI00051C473C|nr:hypothetical protein [[Mycoplasma] collis]